MEGVRGKPVMSQFFNFEKTKKGSSKTYITCHMSSFIIFKVLNLVWPISLAYYIKIYWKVKYMNCSKS